MTTFQKNSASIKAEISPYSGAHRYARIGALALLTVAGLSACDKQAVTEVNVSRALPLAKVNDVEISVLQPMLASRPADSSSSGANEIVDKKLLETLIDRQLLQEEAMRNKLDRSPEVVQALDRAKTQILAEAYLQSKYASAGAPSKAEVDAYFKAHPELFTDRKLYTMKELVFATKDFSAQLSARLDSARSIEEVAAWLEKNHVDFERIQLSRSTADLAPEMISKLETMRRNQLFVVKAGEHSMLDSVYAVKRSPVTAEEAAPQIEHYLRSTKRKEIADAELGRLRAVAKVEYLDTKQIASTAATTPTGKTNRVPRTTPPESGLAGLK